MRKKKCTRSHYMLVLLASYRLEKLSVDEGRVLENWLPSCLTLRNVVISYIFWKLPPITICLNKESFFLQNKSITLFLYYCILIVAANQNMSLTHFLSRQILCVFHHMIYGFLLKLLINLIMEWHSKDIYCCILWPCLTCTYHKVFDGNCLVYVNSRFLDMYTAGKLIASSLLLSGSKDSTRNASSFEIILLSIHARFGQCDISLVLYHYPKRELSMQCHLERLIN